MDELADPAMRVRSRGAPPAPVPLAARVLAACDLHDFAVELVRARARREHPDATELAVEAEVRTWLRGGDESAHGRPIAWPRR